MIKEYGVIQWGCWFVDKGYRRTHEIGKNWAPTPSFYEHEWLNITQNSLTDLHKAVLVFSGAVVAGGVVRHPQEWAGPEGGGVDVADRDQIGPVLPGRATHDLGGTHETGLQFNLL